MRVRNNNRKFFNNIFTLVLIVYGASMIAPFVLACYFDEESAMIALGAGAAICLLSGVIMRKTMDLDVSNVRPRMHYFTATLIWLIIIILTAVILFFGKSESSLINSLFGATAALTTTGIGNLDVSTFTYSFQLWKSLLNWIGGIGIILIAASCLSTWNFSGHTLISVEVPGQEFLKPSASFKQTYKHILYLYSGLTIIQFFLLIAVGMDPYTSLLTSLSNISTAGLQHINHGVITGLSVQIKIIITIFAFLGSVNFSVLLLFLVNKHRTPFRRTELSLYIGRILITAALVGAFAAFFNKIHFFAALGQALMQTVSYLSTSGYIVTDCHNWPAICVILIILQMFFGACSVSTGGGIKTARIGIAFKTVSFGLFRHIHPRAIRPVKFNQETVKQDEFVRANLFVVLFMTIYLLGAFLLSLDNDNANVLEALNYSQAMLTNTGTSIAELNTAGIADHFSPLSKIVMSFEMLAGRLEIYPVLMIFSKSFWKSDKSF